MNAGRRTNPFSVEIKLGARQGAPLHLKRGKPPAIDVNSLHVVKCGRGSQAKQDSVSLDRVLRSSDVLLFGAPAHS